MACGDQAFKSGKDNHLCIQNGYFSFISCVKTPSSPVQPYMFFLGFLFLIQEMVVVALHITLSILPGGMKSSFLVF